jgi:hypothetical protein
MKADNIDERKSIIMVDNGHGKNVHITSVFVSKAYGKIIKSFADENKDLPIMISLEIL